MLSVTDHGQSRAILTSGDFAVVEIAQAYRTMQAQTGLDFSAVIAFLGTLPVFVDGNRHKALRKALAQRLADRKQSQHAEAERFLETFAASALQPGNTVDLFDDFALSLYRAISLPSVPAGVAADEFLDLVIDLPWLFSSFTPLRRRIELNRRLADLFAGSGDEEVALDLAVLVLGAKSLSASLALSLHAVFSIHRGVPLCDMAWPAAITTSSVRFADRVPRQGGVDADIDDRMRCVVHSQDWTAAQNADLMFGAGLHSCLGRVLSEHLWTRTAAIFATSDLRADVGELAFRRDGEPFHLPVACPASFY